MMKTVRLTTFNNSVQAHMLQDMLNDAGIQSMLQGELTNQVMAPIGNIGVQVLVFEQDLDRARTILKEAFPEQ